MLQYLLASIIIPCWKGENFIGACLDSLLRQTYPYYEIIVVDNASPDGSAALIKSRYANNPAIRLLANPRNLGFAGGVNVGLRAAQGDWLILLNQDTVVREDWLAALVEGMNRHQATGIGGCKILDAEWRQIYHAGGRLVWPQALPEHLGFNEVDEGQYDQVQDVEYVTGAAMAIKRAVFETIGGLNERYFFYYEDVDYCYRARQSGYEVTYFPQAVLYHHGAGSLSSDSSEYFFRLNYARLWFVLQHKGLDWLAHHLAPQELTWLKQAKAFNELRGLRRAYAQLMLKLPEVINMSQSSPSANGDKTNEDTPLVDVLQALQSLQEQVRLEMNQAHRPIPQSTQLTELSPTPPEVWWTIKEHSFTSNVPIIGPLISQFRQIWSSIASKWLTLAIITQQNRINWRMIEELHLLNQQLSQRLAAHAEVIGDLDRELIRLTRHVAELSYRTRPSVESNQNSSQE